MLSLVRLIIITLHAYVIVSYISVSCSLCICLPFTWLTNY